MKLRTLLVFLIPGLILLLYFATPILSHSPNSQEKVNPAVEEAPPPVKEVSQTNPEMFMPSITTHSTNLESIASELMSAYLKHFTDNSIPDNQKLLSFQLNEIRINTQNDNSFMFYVDYSVQGINEETSWRAGNGEIQAKGLIKNKISFVRVTKEGNTYTMTGIGTGP